MFHIKSKANYDQQYQASIDDPKKFWGEIASDYFWFERWSEVSNCDLKKAQIRWFENGKTNIAYNCLDRHLARHADKVAIIWEGNDPSEKNRKVTYRELHEKTCQFANLLISRGVKKGDRVCIYMPMIAESIFAILACARIGAVHCVVFAGFSAKALADRIKDCEAKILITADVLFRGDKKIDLAAISSDAALKCEALEEIILFEREDGPRNKCGVTELECEESNRACEVAKPECGVTEPDCGESNRECEVTELECGVTELDCGKPNPECGVTKPECGVALVELGAQTRHPALVAGSTVRLSIWQEEIKNFPTTHQAEICDAEDPLFILYTSGSTGKPKGILHTTGGYMTYAGYSFKNVFQYQENDIFFCSADIGWVTGHSYLIYGPLLNAATILMFEGIPSHPTPARFWEVIAKHKVNIFYTAPTAIRALMQKGDSFVEGHDLSSLKTLGTVGEPINEEAWQWFFEKIGKKKCPIVDTWWQTETGGILISSMAGVFDSKPAHAGLPLPGIVPVLFDDAGNEVVEKNKVGNLCLRQPWPSMARGVWGDPEKFVKTYYEQFPNHYFAGDGAFVSDDGLYRIIGRTDDVIKVSGHRLGTAEIENAINSHPQVSESAVIGVPHEVKGEAIYAFVITKNSAQNLEKEIAEIIVKEIGAIARPEKIYLVVDLPKTRSGKIMRRVLKKIVAGEEDLGDVSTLVNPEVVPLLKSYFL